MHLHLFGSKYLHFRFCQNYIALLGQMMMMMVYFRLFKDFFNQRKFIYLHLFGACTRILGFAKITLLLDASADADILEQESKSHDCHFWQRSFS